MAELIKGHYFTAATLSRMQRWMAADSVCNYYVVFNFAGLPIQWTMITLDCREASHQGAGN
jgi:hypothetical protein